MKKDIKRLLLGLFLALLSAQSIVASDADDSDGGWPSDDESSASVNTGALKADLGNVLSAARSGQPVQQVAQPVQPQNAQPAAQQPAQQQNGAAGFQALRKQMQKLLQPQQAAQPAAQPVVDQLSAATAVSAAQFAPAPPPPPMPSRPIGISRQPVTLDTAKIERDARELVTRNRNKAFRLPKQSQLDPKLLAKMRKANMGDSDSEASDWSDSESGTPVTPYAPSRGFSGDALPPIEEKNEGGSSSESSVSVGSSTDQNGAQPIQAPLDTVFEEQIGLSDAQLDDQINSLATELIDAAIQKALRLKRLDAAIWKNINALQPKR